MKRAATPATRKKSQKTSNPKRRSVASAKKATRAKPKTPRRRKKSISADEEAEAAERLLDQAPSTPAEERDRKKRLERFEAKRAEVRKRCDRELARCALAYDAGNIVALFDAVVTAREREIECHWTSPEGEVRYVKPWDDVPVPLWAVDAVIKVLREAIPLLKTGKLGRHARHLTKFEDDMIDFDRWDAVEGLRNNGVKWKDVYREASDILSGTPAGAGEDAIRISYLKVTKVSRTHPWRYKLPRPRKLNT